MPSSNTFHVANLNPYRYRGYIYDNETGLYYLQSRYYDPITGRFLNADDPAFIGATGTTLSTNLFTYCENNCIFNIDQTGNSKISIKKVEIHFQKIDFRIYRSGNTTKCQAYFEIKCNTITSSLRMKKINLKKYSNSTKKSEIYKNIKMTKSRYRTYDYPAGKYRQVYLFALNIPKKITKVYVSISDLQIYVNQTGWQSLFVINRYISIT